MQDTPARRKLLRAAIDRIGAEALPSRQLEGTFKHEGNRRLFSELKHAEEDFLIQAALRTDRYGKVTAGGLDAIPEGSMRTNEAAMRASSFEIILDDEEADRIVDEYVALVRQSFQLDQAPRVPKEARYVSRDDPEDDGRGVVPSVRDLIAAVFRRRRREHRDGVNDDDNDRPRDSHGQREAD